MLGTIAEKEPPAEKPLQPLEAAGYQALPLSDALRYEPFSRQPYIVRDIAAWAPAGTNAEELAEQLRKDAGELAHKVMLFDRFEKEGRVSLAFRIIFQSFDRTLTEDEATAAMEKVGASFKAKGFEIR
jgi:phenylalanyl-tRNA synthetase beta subunit